MSVATCDLRLPRILWGWPEFLHLDSEILVPLWVPELGPEKGTQLQMISFPLEFMLPRYGHVVFLANFFLSRSISVNVSRCL